MLQRDAYGRFISTNPNAKKRTKKPVVAQLLQPVTLTRTHVAFVVDESGSMNGLKQSTLNCINELINTIRTNSAKYGQDTYFSLTTFANSVRTRINNLPINSVRPLTHSDYYPSGGTALFDAVMNTVNQLSDNGQDAFLVYIITDGEENSSRLNNAHSIKSMISTKQQTDRWTLVFHLPKGYKSKFVNGFGVSTDNVQEWDQTEIGVQDVQRQTTSGMSNYYASRSLGKTATKKFFADLSQVNTTQVQQRLDDLSHQFKTYQVDKECDIKTFVEAKTGKPYNPGSAFYEVTKSEKVQAYKKVLVMPRGDKKIYGGQQARDLVKLPNQDVKLEIKNLATWRLFTQSTSLNRKLVRGTTLIVEK